ncbi:hypothetical protein M7775_05650 [Sporomusa sphaeroides DSM 2875]|nr:hypothetical protein [Sporomusa sphaeroides]MCM0758060.1 hypothetical protein [Sporomusa sphaeroides DSM 2875]
MAKKETPVKILGFLHNGVMYPPDNPPPEVIEKIEKAICKNIPGKKKAG